MATSNLQGDRAARRRPDGVPRCVLSVYGTRPNLVKMAPVMRALRRRLPAARHVSVHTGQHYDRAMSEIFLEELEMPEPDHLLGVGSGSHGEQTGRALERIEQVLTAEAPDLVVVPGDVNSSLAAALAAAKLGIPVAHLEAGLRSYDWTMPEEINRVLIDRLSTWCFTHSPEAVRHLADEGIPTDHVFAVGNTMIDTLVQMLPRITASPILTDLGLDAGGYLLVTLHRPALVDGPMLLDVLAQLDEVSRRIPVVFPMHPRTRANSEGFHSTSGRLSLVEPIGYIDFLALQRGAAGVITDSGGIQEETTFLGVPCFTLRENTERPVTLTHGTNHLLGLRVDAIRHVPDMLGAEPDGSLPPGWDGHAAERVADVLAAAAPAASGDGDSALTPFPA